MISASTIVHNFLSYPISDVKTRVEFSLKLL